MQAILFPKSRGLQIKEGIKRAVGGRESFFFQHLIIKYRPWMIRRNYRSVKRTIKYGPDRLYNYIMYADT